MGDEPQNKTLLRDASIFAVPNWNESLVGMTACCGGSNTENHNINTENEGVYVGGPEKCELWCLIPDEFLYENGTDDRNGNDAKKRNPGSVAASLMESCVKREGNITEDFITIWQVKDAEGSAAAWRGKMSMKMVVTGVVGWGVMLGGLFA